MKVALLGRGNSMRDSRYFLREICYIEYKSQKCSHRITRIVEAGLIKYWKQFYWPSNDECTMSGSTEMNVVMVYITDMQGAFYVIMLGK